MFRRGGMPARPENALQRAEELIAVGQPKQALQVLHDVVTNKKHRTWSKVFEDLMIKLVDLAVEQKNRNSAKEALMQYRNMCQQVAINSLEEVIKHFLDTATAKAEEARLQAEATTLAAVDDLDDARPEDLMLSYVSGDKSKDRTDRELVTPWFRFLWESYRSVLEILRTNPKLELMYGAMAQRAFRFCESYKRTAEFRRLCDILRQHLANMAKYREQRDVTAPESLNLHLETRFEQLRVACELEMWAEAFRTVEDIQALITLGKRQPKHQLMAAYYSRLTQIFAVSGAHLHHAYAWLKLFSFSRSYNKNMTPQDQSMMATSVVLATLSILPYERSLFQRHQDEVALEQERERTIRMANILGFTVDPKRADFRSILTRQALVASIQSMGVLAMCPPEVRQLYELLTAEFDPLRLCSRLAPLLDSIAAVASPMSAASPVKDLSMAHYVPAIKRVAVVRLVRQLSDVYSSMRLAELAPLVPFAALPEVEAVIGDAVKHEYVHARVDHRNGTIAFGAQELEGDKIRNHLQLLAKRLSRAATMINPEPSAAAEQRRLAVVRSCREHVDGEHKRAMARRRVIEKRKEEHEQQLLEQEKAEEEKRLRQAREAEEQEERRRREDAARREKERLERELEEQELEEARKLLEASKRRKGGALPLKEGERLDKHALMQGVVAERLREQQELERRLQRQAKMLDHLERAKREEEVPYIEELYARRAEEDRAAHEAAALAHAKAHREAWEIDVAVKQRLARMRADKDAYAEGVMARRQEVFRALQAQRAKRVEQLRRQRKDEREIKRRQAFVALARQQVEARLEELREARAAAEAEKKRAEEEERRRKLEESLARQRAREEEIEARMREEKAAGRGPAAPPPSAAPSAAAAAADGSSGGGGGPAKFVPPHLRRAGGAAPAAPAAEGGAAGWRSERPAPARDERPAPAAPAAEREGGASGWRGSERRDEAPPAPRPAAPAAAPGSYRPPAARAAGSEPPAEGEGGAYRPPARRW